jgi:hypothetical protein
MCPTNEGTQASDQSDFNPTIALLGTLHHQPEVVAGLVAHQLEALVQPEGPPRPLIAETWFCFKKYFYNLSFLICKFSERRDGQGE